MVTRQGLSYEGEHLRFRVGYEVTDWFNMLHSVDFPDSTNIGKVSRHSSDLTLKRLAVQVGLVF